MTDFHGWSKRTYLSNVHEGAVLQIGRLPARKGVALYEANGSVRVLAWFTSEEAALRALELIDFLTGLTKKLPEEKS